MWPPGQFSIPEPNRLGVSDKTYMSIWEGQLFLALLNFEWVECVD